MDYLAKEGSQRSNDSKAANDPNAPPSYASLGVSERPDTSITKDSLALVPSSSAVVPRLSLNTNTDTDADAERSYYSPASRSGGGFASASASLPLSSLSLIGISHLTIPEFCEHLRYMPDLRTAEIVELWRREVPAGVRHEFVMVKIVSRATTVEGAAGGGGDGEIEMERWVRIDRAAKDYKKIPSRLSLASIASTFMADDSVSFFLTRSTFGPA